jgi:hypothetical protein
LTGKTGALGKWVGNAKHQRNQLFYVFPENLILNEQNDERGDRRRKN